MSILHIPHARMRVRVQRAALSIQTRSREAAWRGIRGSLDTILGILASSPAFYRLVDQVVQYLAHHPDVQALIHEQTSSYMVDAVDDLRSKAASADTAFDRLIDALRRRVAGTSR